VVSTKLLPFSGLLAACGDRRCTTMPLMMERAGWYFSP
jgi:hypothetical protein